MADGVDDLLLWGDDLEVILDILDSDEAVEQQFVAAAYNVSSNCANFRFEFLATDPKRRLFKLIYLWYGKLLQSLECVKPKHLT